MKRKIDFRFIIIIVLIVVLAVMIYLVIKRDNNNLQTQSYDLQSTQRSDTSSAQDSGTSKNQSSNNSEEKANQVTITGSSEVTTALEENISLHATYYYKEIYVEENQKLTAGENILQYTNGEYLVAPYDCVITAISVPDVNAQCTNKHCITVASTKVLQAKIKVSEEKIDSISIGDEATVTVEAVEKEYAAIVTNISSTASNGYFTVTVEFENDGDVLLGMTGDVEI